MTYVWWTLTLLLMLIGLAGTLIPLVPGPAIILSGAVLHMLTIRSAHAIGWKTIAGLSALTVLAYIVDLVSGSVGAKWSGATKWGALGGIAGTVIGLFYGLIGVFILPLVGVMLGELLGGKELLPAWRSTVGTMLGTGAGLLIRFGLGAVMIVWFLLAAR